MLISQWAISLRTPPYLSQMYSTLATCSGTTMFCGHHQLTNLILEVLKLRREKEEDREKGGREREREGGRERKRRYTSDSFQVERMTIIDSSLTLKKGGAWRLITQGLTLHAASSCHWMDWL